MSRSQIQDGFRYYLSILNNKSILFEPDPWEQYIKTTVSAVLFIKTEK